MVSHATRSAATETRQARSRRGRADIESILDPSPRLLRVSSPTHAGRLDEPAGTLWLAVIGAAR
jgi:hypothetical protein